MKDISRIFAATSVLFLIILAVSPTKDHFREWRKHQNDYNQLIMELPKRMKQIPVGIRQIWVRELDRVDRCVSCHLGLSEPLLEDAPQPHRTHPDIYHDFNDFGCTVCHQGQGLATSNAESKGRTKYWDKPILSRQYIESSCGVCHREPAVKEAPVLSHGRALIEEYNCAGCHTLSGFQKKKAPILDGIGNKTTRDWLVRWLRDPAGIQPHTRMPNPQLTDEEAQNLADFLMTFKTYPNEAALAPLPAELEEEYPEEDLVALGKTRVREARCISCHLIDGRGGPLARDLVKVGSKASRKWLYNYIKNPKKLQPGVAMPQYGFSERDLIAVTAYLSTEFMDWDAPEPDTSAHTPDPNYYEKGLALFNANNCVGCHQLTSEPRVAENRGPDLSAMGGKRIYELDFGRTGIEETLTSYIRHKIADPRSFLETARMPRFSFSDEELDAITTALLAMVPEDVVPRPLLVTAPPPSDFDPQGKVGAVFRKYECLSCHSFRGQGFRLATNLSYEGSRVQPDWLKSYFKLPYTLRPTLTERMPNLFMSNEEIEIMSGFLEMVAVKDEIDGAAVVDPSLADEGKALFSEKYGCASCHQVGGEGGYVGPPLDRTGNRLTPGWVFSWLKDPQRWRPDAIDPNHGLTDDETRALTTYLMSLKEGQ